MLLARDLKSWLDRIPPGEGVYVDEGGLALRTEYGAYIEVGGEPIEEDDGE